MKILVLSDSHAGKAFMRLAIKKINPAHVIHLGDHYEDGKAMAELYPHIRFHIVPGNCDHLRCDPYAVETMCYPIGGVNVMMTHGHKHFVKSGIWGLVADAIKRNADIVLYGHTHNADCHREDSGLWVVNPGTCGTFGGSVALIEVEDEKISACRILRETEISAFAE